MELTWNYAEPKDPTDAGGDDDQFEDDGDNTDTDGETGGEMEPPDGEGSDTGGGDGEIGDDGVGDDDIGSDDDDVPERLYTGVSLTTGVAFIDGYFAGATIPVNGAETGEAISDGTVVHEGGEPVTIPVPITDISLSETDRILYNSEYYYIKVI